MRRGLRLVGCVLVLACSDRTAARSSQTGACDSPGAREVVERLGERMKEVPLLASDSVVVREIRRAYAPLVTPELLARWTNDPASAPGREVSSPWPERIEILSVEPSGDSSCAVYGQVVYVSSTEQALDGAAAREPVTLSVTADDGWRIRAFEMGTRSRADVVGERGTWSAESRTAPGVAGPVEAARPAIGTDSTEAADVIRRYYQAIADRDYARAYVLWSDGGAASGQTLEEFAAGYAETARVEVEIGRPGRVEGAAGSRYIQIPVVVLAETVDGEMQRFEGTYTLRRSVVEGATAEQRGWRIYDAELRRTR